MTALSGQIYAELAEIVGARNVSRDAAVTASHDWFGLGAMPTSRTLLGNPPGAVVLPASTEEVAAIVKACNRHGIGFKAHSTGFGNYAGVGTAGSISIDLRRMNRLEIDPVNRMAVIEPYVTAGQLMAEAMQHNLTCHVVGAGLVHSPLASASAYMGVGVTGNHTSNNVRNMLSLEWVTPEGEIVRIGSSGSGAGWFTGEGPGPGFRGMIRGIVGTAGALGVFTRIGYKLYPWAGEGLQWTGEHPCRGIRLPEHSSFHQLSWPSWEAMTRATYRLQRARIPTFVTRTPPSAIGHMITSNNTEFYARHQAGTLPPVATAETARGWSLILMGWSAEELAWKREVLARVLADTGGEELELSGADRAVLAANSVTSIYVARFLRMGGIAAVTNGVMDSLGTLPKLMRRSDEMIGDATQPGGDLLEVSTEQNWMWLNEGRHYWSENNPPADRHNPRSRAAAMYMMLKTFRRNEQDAIGFAAFVQGEMSDMFGAAHGNVQKWMRQVKRTFDPRNLSDSPHFIAPEEPGVAKVWPLAKKVVFQRWFAPIMRFLLSRMN